MRKKLGDKKITRSTGIPITVGRVCYGFAGGGYTGKTTELDESVQKSAEILREMFHKAIEIRFNSDRESGGAWIKDNFGSTQVGLNTSLRGQNEQGLSIGTYVSVTVLKDESLYPVRDDAVYYRYHREDSTEPDTVSIHQPDLATAVAWLKDNVDPKKIRVRKK